MANTQAQFIGVAGPGWFRTRDGLYTKWDLRCAWDAIACSEHFGFAHPSSAPQIWFLDEQLTELGLGFYPENPRATEKERGESLKRQLKAAGGPFLQKALDRGWELVNPTKGLTPRTPMRTVGTDGRRYVVLVLEPYQSISDRKNDTIAGDDGSNTGLGEEPGTRAINIIRRTELVNELLGVLPGSTPAGTGRKVLDDIAERKLRDERRGKKVKHVIKTQGVMPQLSSRAATGAEGPMPALRYVRQPTAAEVDNCEFAVSIDRRWSYPSCGNNVELGYGEPTWVDAATATQLAHALATTGKISTFALWRCEHPGWQNLLPADTTDQRLPAPAVDLRNPANTAWLLPSTMRTLLGPRDVPSAPGFAIDPDALGITGAWIWPGHGRLLESFYKKMRGCWRYLRDTPDLDEDLRAWLLRFDKACGQGTLGSFNSAYAQKETGKPWQYQPIWWQAVKAESAARLCSLAIRIADQHHIWPIEVNTDNLIYLTDQPTFDALAELDQGNLGNAKIDKHAILFPDLDADTEQVRADLVRLGNRRPSAFIPWQTPYIPTEELEAAENDAAEQAD